MSYDLLPLIVKNGLAERPQDLVVTEATCREVEQMAAERRKNAPAPVPATTDLHVEYTSLRRRLFELQANARSLETKVNDLAGKVALLEQRLTEVLKKKKEYADVNNLLAERFQEHAAKALEVELADATKELEKHKRYSASAFRELQKFDGHQRLAEVKAYFGDGGPAHSQASKNSLPHPE